MEFSYQLSSLGASDRRGATGDQRLFEGLLGFVARIERVGLGRPRGFEHALAVGNARGLGRFEGRGGMVELATEKAARGLEVVVGAHAPADRPDEQRAPA